MKAVNVAELRAQLSRYLQMARRGETILVKDRNQVVARIEAAGPETAPGGGDAARLADLELRGVLRRRRGPITDDLLARRPRVDADVVQALLDEREEGR